MNCDRCRNSKATIHMTEIINDNRSEVHLCETCAKEMGLNTKLSNFSLTATDMLSFLDINEISGEGNSSTRGKGEDLLYNDSDNFACEQCGSTFLDFKRTGKLGCEQCYINMNTPLESVISSQHGGKIHVGKIPHVIHDIIENPDEKKTETNSYKNESLLTLRKKLDEAVAEERYEDAALLRDLINK